MADVALKTTSIRISRDVLNILRAAALARADGHPGRWSVSRVVADLTLHHRDALLRGQLSRDKIRDA